MVWLYRALINTYYHIRIFKFASLVFLGVRGGIEVIPVIITKLVNGNRLKDYIEHPIDLNDQGICLILYRFKGINLRRAQV